MNFWINKFRKIPKSAPYSLLIAFLFLACGSIAQQALPLTANIPAKTEFIHNDFWFWETSGKGKSALKDAIHAEAEFRNLPKLYPNFGFVLHDVWFRFVLENKTSDTLKSLFRLSNPNLDEIDLYQKSNSSPWNQVAAVGDIRPKENKQFENRNFIIPLSVGPHSRDTFLLRVNNGGEQFHFIPALVSYDYFLGEDASSQLYFGIYFGIIAFIIVFNLFSYFALGDKTALWYASYVFCLGMLQISLVGIGSYHLWSGEYFSDRANPFFASTSVLFLLYFCMDYLKTKQIMPKIHKIFHVFHVAILACVIFSVLPLNLFYHISVMGINVITLLLNMLILPVAYIAVRKNIREAKLFLIAFTVLIIAVFGFILKNFGIIPSSFLTDFGMQIGSSLESILLSIGIVLKYKRTRETAMVSLRNINDLTEQANLVLEQKVAERTVEMEKQKLRLEIKNSKILSSISYAKRIQESLLPSGQSILNLLPHSTLWYAPKDIIAGDFYWVNQVKFGGENWIFFAVGDCTGHGVPGAMMSVLCINALESALKELESPDPGALLEKAAEYLNINLSNDNQQINDGMDISMACIQMETKVLRWAGANNPLWICRDSEIIQCTATKRPVGKTDILTPFANHLIQLQSKDRLYLFSDGYADQFGGPRNKKFKRGNFLKVIEENCALDRIDQMDAIKGAFYEWKGEEEQVDDVCILQVEIN